MKVRLIQNLVALLCVVTTSVAAAAVGSNSTSCKTIAEILQGNKEFSILVQAATVTGLAATLAEASMTIC